MNCRILADLQLEDTKGRQKFADPRITMELRHKQVCRQGSTVKRCKIEDYRIRVNAQRYLPGVLSQPAVIPDLQANTLGYSSKV